MHLEREQNRAHARQDDGQRRVSGGRWRWNEQRVHHRKDERIAPHPAVIHEGHLHPTKPVSRKRSLVGSDESRYKHETRCGEPRIPVPSQEAPPLRSTSGNCRIYYSKSSYIIAYLYKNASSCLNTSVNRLVDVQNRFDRVACRNIVLFI